MTLPDALDRHRTDELAALTRPAVERITTPTLGVPTEPGPTAPRVRIPTVGGVKRRVRRIAVSSLHSAARRLRHAAVGREFVEPFVAERTDPLVDRVAALSAQVATLSAQLAVVATDQGQSVADRINMALLKDDVISISGRVDSVLGQMGQQEQRLIDLGMAFAPGAGLVGAGARFAELREQINSVERRLRHAPAAAALDVGASAAEGSHAGPIDSHSLLPKSADTAPTGTEIVPPAAAAPAETSTRPSSVASELFNYVAFERRFRGDPEAILEMQRERYQDLLSVHAPVVDIGCGRAELLEQLALAGVPCIGVDTDSGMVAEGRARGLDIRHIDAISFLEQAEPHSLGSVFSAHVAEHLDLDVLIRFLELSAAKLRPGGVFVAETPNPASLIVLGNSYILDPTHVRPLHPSLLAFLCETAGFRDVRLEFFSPATGYHLSKVNDADAPDWVRTLNANTERLNEVLFGPQEYAVIATTPS